MNNLAHQEEVWEELHNGQAVAISPRPSVNHNIIIGNIFKVFSAFLENKPCTVFVDGVDVFLTEKDRVIPDVMIVCNKDIIKKKGIYGVPDLIVEVLSPDTAKKDRGYKKDLYEKCGVKEYWIVETETSSIEVYLLKDNKFELDEVYSILPDYLLEDMTDVEKKSIKHEFKTSLYDDMTIVLEDVFTGRF